MSSKFYSNGECKKFQPNIFNKVKCTYCFKPKEEHSNEALESNRVTRKAVKCGYLFVAPFSDFSNPINKSKRWQRRWFVLYDDGELKYALDDYPETVPQACIDMNKVSGVTSAEERTGHAFSLSIDTGDKVHYVKATCREEAQWWRDVLNACSQGRKSVKAGSNNSSSYSTRLSSSSNPNVWESGDIFPTRERDVQINIPTNNENNMSAANVQTKIYVGSPPTRDKVTSEEKTRLRVQSSGSNRLHTDTVDFARSPLSNGGPEFRTSTSSPSTPEYTRSSPITTSNEFTRSSPKSSEYSRTKSNDSHSSSRCTSSAVDFQRTTANSSRDYARNKADFSRINEFSRSSPKTSDYIRSPPIVSSDSLPLTSLNRSRLSPSSSGVSSSSSLSNSLSSSGVSSGKSGRSTSSGDEGKLSGSVTPTSWESSDKNSPTPSSGNLRRSSSVLSQSGSLILDEKPVRGDPDGCGLDLTTRRHSPTPELRLDLNPTGSDLYVNNKKGWLMKQSPNGQSWSKHWFVLRGCSLLFYRDPKAEESGALDGVVALNNVTALTEVPVARNFGFQITTWDSKRTILSAVTAGIRNNWMAAIKRTATLNFLDDKQDSTSIVQQDSPSTPRSVLFSSDDEYRTASEGGRRGSTASDWGEILPPSPPLIRTPISRVKERARSISRSGTSPGSGGGSQGRLSLSRSRSSPPSSRRSTLDSVQTDDLSLPCCPENECEASLLLNEKLSSDSRQHRRDLEELKAQLNSSLLDLTNAEQEILSLKHFKREAEELRSTLHRTEELLKAKTEEANEAGSFKSRYFKDKAEWEAELNTAEIELVTSGRRVEELCRQLGQSRERVERLRGELEEYRSTHRELEQCRANQAELEERLSRGMEENESLYRRIRELEGNHSLRESKGRSLDSLSDLTNVYLDLDLDQLDKDRVVEEFDNLRSRFEKAVSEIRIMKRELRLAQSEQDNVELSLIALSQELKAQQDQTDSQQALMAAKIQDLTLKLSAAEKQVRAFRHKMSKLETRDKRHRSLSLKGDSKESLTMCKELEEKLYQLEVKLSAVERGNDKSTPNLPALCPGSKMTRLRRKSLDSVSEAFTSSDPMKILFRVTDLEKRINKTIPQGPLSQINEKEVETRPPPSSAIVILNDSPRRAGFVCDDSARGEPDLSRSGPESLRSLEHASLLSSIEYEVSQIESLVREHSNSLSDLEMSRDFASNLQDASFVADLSNKCGDIKQQIVSLQDLLKQAEGGVTLCTRCCQVPVDAPPLESCKQCAVLDAELSNRTETCDRMEKMLEEAEQELRRKQEEWKRLGEQCSESQESEQEMREQIERLTEDHQKKCRELESIIREKERSIDWKRREYEKKVEELANEYEEEKEMLINVHEDQCSQLKAKISSLESRLGTLDSDYGEEIVKLRAAYEESVSEAESQAFLPGSKYKHEMEHIKSLCEKGLQAMEFSYRRMIEELKAKHAEEVESLRQEKEQALREETEATLAALDVMRKAHDLEVEKKMNSIMKRMQANHDMSTLHSQHQAEMESIKQEIISLSEKYSAKCVESSDLNERLRQLTRSLTQARAHINELENRNTKLRQRINED